MKINQDIGELSTGGNVALLGALALWLGRHHQSMVDHDHSDHEASTGV